MLTAISTQVAPKDPGVAYWAGEPDRLARAVVFIAQRKLHSDADTGIKQLVSPVRDSLKFVP